MRCHDSTLLTNQPTFRAFDLPDFTSDFSMPEMNLNLGDFTLNGALGLDKVEFGDLEGFSLDLSGIEFGIGEGASEIGVSDALGNLVMTSAGIAGELSGSIDIGSPGAQFGGDYTIAINTLSEDVS